MILIGNFYKYTLLKRDEVINITELKSNFLDIPIDELKRRLKEFPFIKYSPPNTVQLVRGESVRKGMSALDGLLDNTVSMAEKFTIIAVEYKKFFI